MLAVWVLAMAPAAAITLLKFHWSYFLFGFLTLGIVWVIGSTILAAPHSLWAKWFYDGETLALAGIPGHHPRSRPAVLYALGGIAVAILGFGLFAARPVPVLGVSGGALQSSVGGGALPGFWQEPCERIDDETWTCMRWDNQMSGQVAYRVHLNRLGCWKATPGGPGGGSEDQLSGCVTILDEV